MGYYIKYSLDEVDGDREALHRALIDGCAVDIRHTANLKWYEHETDMAMAMARAGVSRVVLHLEGEDRGDIMDKEFCFNTGTGLVGIKRFRGRWMRNAEPES